MNVGGRAPGRQEILPGPNPLLALAGQMAARRTLPLLVALWAMLVQAQTYQTVTANTRFLLNDGGTAEPRAYAVYTNQATPYVMAGTGGNLQVFDISGNPVSSASGQFDVFAVVNGVDFGGQTGTLVATGSFETLTCGGQRCLRVFRWDPVAGFQSLNFTTTSVNVMSAMTIDATAAPTFAIYYSSIGPAGFQPVYRQDISVASDGGVTFLAANMTNRTIPTNTVGGMAAYAGTTLFVTQDVSDLDSFPTDLTNLTGGTYIPHSSGDFGDLSGLALIGLSDGGTGMVAGDTQRNAVQFFDTVDAGYFGGITVLTLDGGRPVTAHGAAATPNNTLLIVTEPATPSIPEIAGNAAVYLATFTFPSGSGGLDGGGPDGGGGGGIPVIPSIPPGPGAVPPSNYGCSSVSGVPLLFTILIPLLLPRRRRRP